jgi:hypothetical protein
MIVVDFCFLIVQDRIAWLWTHLKSTPILSNQNRFES